MTELRDQLFVPDIACKSSESAAAEEGFVCTSGSGWETYEWFVERGRAYVSKMSEGGD